MQEIRHLTEHARGLLAVRDVSAPLENHRARRALNEPGDPLGVSGRAELVIVSVQGERRTADTPQLVVEAPLPERRIEPRVDPRVQYPPRLRAVSAFKPFDLSRLLEGRLRGADAGECAILDE